MRFSIAVRCACGAGCSKLHRADGKTWNPRHGSAGFVIRCLPTSGGSKRSGGSGTQHGRRQG